VEVVAEVQAFQLVELVVQVVVVGVPTLVVLLVQELLVRVLRAV
jgi:hypothetical protein